MDRPENGMGSNQVMFVELSDCKRPVGKPRNSQSKPTLILRRWKTTDKELSRDEVMQAVKCFEERRSYNPEINCALKYGVFLSLPFDGRFLKIIWHVSFVVVSNIYGRQD